jgi:hypothetical protein
MLTAKREHFCQEMIKPKANQTKAYRIAFNSSGMKASTIHREACALMKDHKITARIEELMKPIIEKAQLTREQWIKDGMKLYQADPRKLFDKFGNAIPIAELGDDEITLLEGFKHKDLYTALKRANGEEQAEATGFQDEYKITSYKERHEYIGKAMGFLKEKEGVDLADLIEELVKLSRTDAAKSD